MEFKIETKENNPCVISFRTTEANKKFITNLAKKHKCEQADVLRQIIDQFRQVESDSNKGKSKRSN